MTTVADLDALEGALTAAAPAGVTGSMFVCRRATVRHYLIGQGMAPGAIQMHRLDLDPIKPDGDGFRIPASFMASVRATFPQAFGSPATAAAFDARTAPAEEVDRQLRDLETGRYRNRLDAASARTLADLERTYPAAV